MGEAVQCWVGKAQFLDKAEFYFGTVQLPVHAKNHEIDEALKKLWAEIFPFHCPAFIALPGMVIFQSQEVFL